MVLIDDEQSIRLPLRLALERHGYAVLEAVDGQQGIDLIRTHATTIAVVVIDNHMPRMSGAEVIRELRRSSCRPAIVFMSGVSLDDTGLGASDTEVFLRKPFELAQFIHTVDRLTADHGERDREARAG